MACDLKVLNSYGTGALGDVENPSGQINSYANVTAYTTTTITIGSSSNGVNEKFVAENEIMIHVSASNGTSTDTTYLGKYLVCKITAVVGSVLTVDKDFTAILPTAQLTNYQVQAITIAQYKNLTLSTSTITPLAYNVSNKYGGILLAKCTDTITYSGGNISTLDKGIPTGSTAYRPLTAQEKDGTTDRNKYSGWENSSALRQFLLNAGDGAVMIIAKHFSQVGTTSRIGGTTAGIQSQRGDAGGATIVLINDDMTGFDCSIISKRKGSGQGLGRCYIASNTKLRNDEGLYAYDCISNPYRLMRSLNIKGYGDASMGDVTNPTQAFNNYANITAISADGKTITYNNKTTNGMAQISAGNRVMFHVSKYLDNTDMDLLGKFIFANVLSDDGNTIVLDTAVTSIFNLSKLSKYNCQIISLAQFNTLTLTTQHKATTAWNDTTKVGGICAVAVKDKCDITGGGIIVEGKGGGVDYHTDNGFKFIGNAQMADILPLGSGGGSVVVISKELISNSAARLGGSQDGANVYGRGGKGYPSKTGYSTTESGYLYSSNTTVTTKESSDRNGCSIFLICDNAKGLSLSNLSSGGLGGVPSLDRGNSRTYAGVTGEGGGAGYGGGGGGSTSDDGVYVQTQDGIPSSYIYGGRGGQGDYTVRSQNGGLTGFAFVYCNNIENEDMTGMVAI